MSMIAKSKEGRRRVLTRDAREGIKQQDVFELADNEFAVVRMPARVPVTVCAELTRRVREHEERQRQRGKHLRRASVPGLDLALGKSLSTPQRAGPSTSSWAVSSGTCCEISAVRTHQPLGRLPK